MQQKRLAVWALFMILLNGCVPITQQSGTGTIGTGSTGQYLNNQLQYEDFTYDPQVKSVQLYVQSGHPQQVLNPPIIPLTQEQPLVLEFDQLQANQQRFVVKLIYCNSDWNEARLAPMQYLQAFNEFYITDITPSYNTRVPFFHYRFLVPQVKLSGNYLLVVTDQNGRNILSRRMMVFEELITVGSEPVLTSGGSAQFTNQQINFNLFYNKYPLVNPAQEVKVVLRQNYRWDNAKTNLRPSYVRDNEKRLEYTFFELQHTFVGLNEFRFFDNRSRRYLGANIATANREVIPEEVVLVTDLSRARDVYSSQQDINGRYIFGNRDYGNEVASADYNWVTFTLDAAKPAPGDVYIFGELSDWKLLPAYKIAYDAANLRYTGRVYLKQGYYNYYYAVLPSGETNPDEVYFEGSFNNTENRYDILVYYRPPGSRSDLLIGYQEVNVNSRR